MKRIFTIALVFVIFASCSCVFAQDNATAIDEPADADIEETPVDEIMTKDDGTFTALQGKIENAQAGSTINLENDYAYDDGFSTNGIEIKKSITINGNGHTIDGKSKSKIFHLTYAEKNYGHSDSFTLTVKNVKFINAKSEDYGGAIRSTSGTFYGKSVFDSYSYSWSIDISNCIFEGNKGKYGGAVYQQGDNKLTVKDSTFTNNEAPYGGALNSRNVYVSNCVFTSNSAEDGGAVSGNTLELNGCTFSYNKASDRGGAVLGGCNAVNCVFTSNSAKNGGAIWSSQHQIAENCKFTSNHASNKGGAVYFDSETSTAYYTNMIANCDFIQNTADSYGGAIYAVSGTYNGKTYGGHAEKCTFSKNKGIKDDGVYGTTTVDCKFIVPVLSAKSVTKTYATSTKLVVYLKDSAGNAISDTITVNVNGDTAKIKSDTQGKASMAINLVPGTYYAKVTYQDAKEISVKIVVKKAAVKMTAKSKSYKAKASKKYSVTLKTSQNKALKNVKLTLKVNKATYTAKTNSKGVATFKTTKLVKKGTYAAVVKFAGNKYYSAKTAKAKITVR